MTGFFMYILYIHGLLETGGGISEGGDHIAEDHIAAGHQPGGGHPVPAADRTVVCRRATQGVVKLDGLAAGQAGQHNVTVALNVSRQAAHMTHD